MDPSGRHLILKTQRNPTAFAPCGSSLYKQSSVIAEMCKQFFKRCISPLLCIWTPLSLVKEKGLVL
jgi:hypothetical protein